MHSLNISSFLLFGGALLGGIVSAAHGQSTPTDAEIQAAIQHGQSTDARKLWKEIRKDREVRINRAGFDPIEKKLVLLHDSDRIALEASEAKRQMRQITVADIHQKLPLGVIELLLEANCYNHMYAGSLEKWGPNGNVHMVLNIDGRVIQPGQKVAGRSDSTVVGAEEHGLVTRNGAFTTYTPLYQSAIYERASQRSWFIFDLPPANAREIVAIAIAGDGARKEKDITELIASE